MFINNLQKFLLFIITYIRLNFNRSSLIIYLKHFLFFNFIKQYIIIILRFLNNLIKHFSLFIIFIIKHFYKFLVIALRQCLLHNSINNTLQIIKFILYLSIIIRFSKSLHIFNIVLIVQFLFILRWCEIPIFNNTFTNKYIIQLSTCVDFR